MYPFQNCTTIILYKNKTSADIHIPHPYSTQSFNRYAYVRNNPLGFVDPSGYTDESVNDNGGTTPNNEGTSKDTTPTSRSILTSPEVLNFAIDVTSVVAGATNQLTFGLTGSFAQQYVNSETEQKEIEESTAYKVGEYGTVAAEFYVGVGALKQFGKAGFKSLWGINKDKIARLFSKGQGFDSFYLLKKHLSPAGEGRAWHHVVEQHEKNIARFGNKAIHNTKNVVNVPDGAGQLHKQINRHYMTKFEKYNGLSTREWVSQKSYKEQYNYGMKVMNNLIKQGYRK